MAGMNESIDRWKSVEKGKSNFFPWLSRFPWTEFRGSPLRQGTVCCNLDQLRRFVRLQSGADRRRDNNLMELAARSNTTICDPLVWDSVRFPILFRSLKRWHLWRVKWEMAKGWHFGCVGERERVHWEGWRGRGQPLYDQHFDATSATVSANRTYRCYDKFHILCTERGECVAWATFVPTIWCYQCKCPINLCLIPKWA